MISKKLCSTRVKPGGLATNNITELMTHFVLKINS